MLCSYSIKPEAGKPQEERGLGLSICLAHNPSATSAGEKNREGKKKGKQPTELRSLSQIRSTTTLHSCFLSLKKK